MATDLKTDMEFQGMLLDGDNTSDNDFILGSANLNDMIERGSVRKETPEIFYNQAAQRRTRNGCTLYMAMGLISDLNGYVFSLTEILQIHDLAERSYGWREDRGGYLYKAMDCVRTYWNTKYPNQELISFRLQLTSDEAQKLIEEGKSMGIGYRTTSEHYTDSQDNGKMDTASFKGKKILGGHAIRHNGASEAGIINIDNYTGHKKHNEYINERLQKYVEDGTYFNEGYVFFKKEESEFPDVPLNHPFYYAAKFMKDNGLLNGYSDGTMRLDQPISRGEICKIFERVLDNEDDTKKKSWFQFGK